LKFFGTAEAGSARMLHRTLCFPAMRPSIQLTRFRAIGLRVKFHNT
jgi:hypothetical protein